ncbi:hypothetical protein C7C46_27065 [Streptomyces tateyamensis]|uniref:Uncharacterized protein n=1 Tax=Streptomyces tateyamensis TaxID=565073 RepID=A0A2V4N9P8_9ACTN|nr:hypothetical protein [Streptomyces tateyamensis]PYC71001.1 hypothetical protein C7C46_27065 [Streptomyces tateyamensis]
MISTARLGLQDPREAADLAAFLTRLLRFDRAAAVRLQVVGAPGAQVLAVYGRLPLGSTGVLALRTARLAATPDTAADSAPGTGAVASAVVGAVDATVSAGQLLEGLDEEQGAVALPAPVTGPSWAGLLPPRVGWQPLGNASVDQVMPQLLASIEEFKERSAAVPEQHRTRAVLDPIADEIWARPLAALPELPLRAVHAAYRIGFLHPGAQLTAHRTAAWLRLSAPHGTVVLRTAAPGAGLGLSPLL